MEGALLRIVQVVLVRVKKKTCEKRLWLNARCFIKSNAAVYLSWSRQSLYFFFVEKVNWIVALRVFEALKALTPVHVIYSRCFGPQTLLIWTIAIFLNEFWFPEKSKPITLRIIYRTICHCEISQKYLPLSRKGNGVEVDLHVTHVQW